MCVWNFGIFVFAGALGVFPFRAVLLLMMCMVNVGKKPTPKANRPKIPPTTHPPCPEKGNGAIILISRKGNPIPHICPFFFLFRRLLHFVVGI